MITSNLDHPGVEASNNRAQRPLRPAVIARKLSWGNKTEAGARTFEILAGLAATCAQRASIFTTFLHPLLVLPTPFPLAHHVRSRWQRSTG